MGVLFVCFGVFVFLLGIFLIWPTLGLMVTYPIKPDKIIRLEVFVLVTTVLGLGLILMRRWAAILFSTAFASLGLFLILGSLLYAPPILILMILPFGLLCLVPAVATKQGWNRLKWTGEWPF
jgi:hypothetical protein